MTKKSKKEGSNSSSFSSREIGMLLIIIVILVMMAYLRMTHMESGQSYKLSLRTPSEVSPEKYKVLYDRAMQLTHRYKSITNSTSLPAELEVLEKLAAKGVNPTMSEGATSTGVSSDTKSAAANVVLGMAQDTDSKNFAVFCKSLRSVSEADAVIFVNTPVPDRHKTIAHDNRITLIEFSLDDMDVSMKKYHPSTLRWVLFHNYFIDNQQLLEKYKHIWMIDVRDSYFQSDPFAFVLAEEAAQSAANTQRASIFHVFNGVESMKIATCGWNSGWVRDCFGEQMVAKIGNQNIICSGVSVGPTDAAIRYIGLMNSLITNHDVPAALGYSSKFPQCERNGVDQGVHNVLVHTNALTQISSADKTSLPINVKKWSQRDSPVANMQAKMMKVMDNVVWNGANQKVAVVHQYDRYPELQAFLFGKYVDWLNANDFSAVWADEPTCAKFNYKQDADLFKGKCDLKMAGGATSAAACCKHCTDTPSCKAFTFWSSVCYMKSCTDQSSSGSDMRGAVSGFLK